MQVVHKRQTAYVKEERVNRLIDGSQFLRPFNIGNISIDKIKAKYYKNRSNFPGGPFSNFHKNTYDFSLLWI